MNKEQATVVIWGNDNYNVLGLLRQLTPFVDVVIFLINKTKGHCASKSRYCANTVVAKTTDDALSFLNTLNSKHQNKAFLITTSDLLASLVDMHREQLSKKFILCTTKKQGTLTQSQDKNYQYELASKIGIKVPQSAILKFDSPIGYISYPCLIKPSFKLVGIKHPFKTYKCVNEGELLKAQRLLDKNGTYTLQRFVVKEKDILVYGCRFPDGNVVYAGTFTKCRWSKGGDGSYGTIESHIPNCIDLNKLNAFLKEIEYFGLFSAEFGVENGIAWFYEFNLRNDGTSHYFYQSGLLNLPLLWVKNNIGSTTKLTCTNETSSIFIDEIEDFDNVKGNLISKSDWKLQRKSATIFKYYDKTDIKPYIYVKAYYLLRHTYHALKLKKLFNMLNYRKLTRGGVIFKPNCVRLDVFYCNTYRIGLENFKAA